MGGANKERNEGVGIGVEGQVVTRVGVGGAVVGWVISEDEVRRALMIEKLRTMRTLCFEMRRLRCSSDRTISGGLIVMSQGMQWNPLNPPSGCEGVPGEHP